MARPSEFTGYNLAYLVALLDRLEADPASVPPDLRETLQQLAGANGRHPSSPEQPGAFTAAGAEKVIAAANLASAVRSFGHLAAQLDPLGTPPPGDPSLSLESYQLTEADLSSLPSTVVGGPIAGAAANALEAIQVLRSIYCASSGYDYAHITIPAEREWLREAAECGRFRAPLAPEQSLQLHDRLSQVAAFEHFLHRYFPGKTRFSIEGLDMLIPMLDELVRETVEDSICMVMLGMAHRGRLNVLAHVFSKPYPHILAEFKDPGGNYTTLEELGWTGDVKYHTGASRAVQEDSRVQTVLCMAPNPSHLEHVNPVVMGMARAGASGVNQRGAPAFFPKAVLPLLIHGDAAFPGEGVVAETLNFSHLPGYHVAGTIHIIANNQLGFTTTPNQGRSTRYASDLARGFETPILHVNADDPLACLEAVRTAFAYRQTFQKDFLIDLIGYRRFGHNEGDEPSYTQPAMYQRVEGHAPVYRLWAQRLSEQGLLPEAGQEDREQAHFHSLQTIFEQLNPAAELWTPQPDTFQNGAGAQLDTAVPAQTLRQLHAALHQLPDGFTLNRKLARAFQRRAAALDNESEAAIDWGLAESLAFASILADGTPIRLTGQDVERGTFSHRNAVLHAAQGDGVVIPLQNLPQAQAAFEIHNSPLSENAALGFEYGYNIAFAGRLVIWEAQYGDFVNGAQAMIDEFLVSGRAKWDQRPSLVLLLPHGHEGQGPDHSSGRIERFLQLSSGSNLRVANCTSAAQYFHLLRRQAALLKTRPLPLVVFTPKSLLRHPRVASRLSDLSAGCWQPVLDQDHPADRAGVRRLLLCSGKVAIDLLDHPAMANRPDLALIRLEQLAPFPTAELTQVLSRYPQTAEAVWVQEEPQNMGPWTWIQPHVQPLLNGRTLRYTGRGPSASPAEGSLTWHKANQAEVLETALALP